MSNSSIFFFDNYLPDDVAKQLHEIGLLHFLGFLEALLKKVRDLTNLAKLLKIDLLATLAFV